MAFYYSSTRTGIPFNWPLWKLKNERKEEWNAIVDKFLSIQTEFVDHLIKDEEVKNLFNGSKNFSTDTKDKKFTESLVNFFADRTQKTFGWLTTLILNILGAKHPAISFLSDLHGVFEPIVIVKNLCSDVLYVSLGSCTTLEVEARGSPQVLYQWLYMALHDEENSRKWKRLDLHSQCRALTITNVRLSDCGAYRCRIYHGIPVKMEDESFVQDVFSHCVRIKPRDGSINIIDQPTDADAYICGQVHFQVTAESTDRLQYQWYFEDSKVISENAFDDGKLALSNLRCEQSGWYKCKIFNNFESVESKLVKLTVHIPNREEIQRYNITFDNENIQILKQPSFNSSSRVNKGDKISLEVVVSCKYQLKYEWFKRGLKQDLIDRTKPEEVTPLIPVCHGPQLVDEISSQESRFTSGCPIGTWIYACLITCPHTNESVASESVHIPLSLCTSVPSSFPGFKIALIICQEDYKGCDFHELQAPKYDGSALMVALKEMDFEIFSFVNLKVEEIRNAVELLCGFIDDTTYVLFYYNGHALGSGTDIYLTGLDSTLSGSLNEFIWHGELESLIDSCSPLLCIFIYDSCRDDPPFSFQEKIRSVKHKAVPFKSSFVISYGTQPSMKSFECYEKSLGASQGLYMKYLLQHVRDNIRVEEVFIKLSDSFMSGEDTSVVTKMRPEIKVSTKQAFYLSAPLRSNRFNSKHSLFVQMCRFQSCVKSSGPNAIIENEFKYLLGLAYDKITKNLIWVTGASNVTNPLSFIIKIVVKESDFVNEAIIGLSVSRIGPKIDNVGGLYELQLSSPNVELVLTTGSQFSHAPITVLFRPCRSKIIERIDGPIFDFMSAKGEEMNGECKMVSLQNVDGNAKIRLNLRTKNDESVIPCIGVLEFPLPILQNFPFLKLTSKSVRQLIR